MWVAYDICGFDEWVYSKATTCFVEDKQHHTLYEGFKYDMFMKMLGLLRLQSTPLNQVGEVLNNLPYF